MNELLSKQFAETQNLLEKSFSDLENGLFESFQKVGNEILNLAGDSDFSSFSIVDLNGQMNGADQKAGLPKLLRIGKMYPTHASPNIRSRITQPLLLPFTESWATAFLLKENDQKDVHLLFTQMALRLMLSLPPDLCRFDFVDNNFGRDFALLNRLNKKVINSTIVTDTKILNQLIDDMEKRVVESYRKFLVDFETLEDYNKANPKLTQPYQFVFFANFPAGFTPETASKLYGLINNGNAAKAGIYIFYSVDKRLATNANIKVDSFAEISCRIYQNNPEDYEIENSVFSKKFNDSFNITLDTELPKDVLDSVFDLINGKKVKSQIVSFEGEYKDRMAKRDIWKGSTIENIEIPIGYAAGSQRYYLSFGKKTNDYFGLIGGLPGTGKTVLLHNIILWGAMEYSPKELNYYLIDCKNGTGFNVYKDLPHVNILSVSNDREFAASALSHLALEMYERAETFKKEGAKCGQLIDNIKDYRRSSGQPMPRILAIVDEFQVLFEKEDKVSRIIRNTLNKLFTEGRAFGISIILCSQGLGRVDVPIKNITWRLSFRLISEMESERILGNGGALGLTRIGNAIINNQNGLKDSNINIQVGYVDDVHSLVGDLSEEFQRQFPGEELHPFISDGNTNGRISHNSTLTSCLVEDKFKINDRFCDVYLGEPAFIRDKHAFVRIRRQQASNVVMVGSDLTSAITLTGLITFQLAKQSDPCSRFYIVDSFNIDSEYSGRMEFAKSYIPNLTIVHSKRIAEVVDEVHEDLEQRIGMERNGEPLPGRVVLSLLYMQNNRMLKKEGYNLSPVTKKLMRIIKEGPEYGLHVVCHSLTYPGLLEILDSSTLNEFENRIALDDGKSMSIITEQTSSSIRQKGSVLLQAPDEFMTYNPDLLRVYSECNVGSTNENIRFIQELLNPVQNG